MRDYGLVDDERYNYSPFFESPAQNPDAFNHMQQDYSPIPYPQSPFMHPQNHYIFPPINHNPYHPNQNIVQESIDPLKRRTEKIMERNSQKIDEKTLEKKRIFTQA